MTSDNTYGDPKLAINRVYTKKGDGGTTQLVGGQHVRKDDPRIIAYGTVDELNAVIGMVRAGIDEHVAAVPALAELGAILVRVQHELFNLGSILATQPQDQHAKQARVTAADIAALERDLDRANEGLAPLRSFVLPGGHRINAALHLARTVCRRAERCCVTLARDDSVEPTTIAYLNRLSDALFVWSRWVSAELGAAETLWSPNAAASASA